MIGKLYHKIFTGCLKIVGWENDALPGFPGHILSQILIRQEQDRVRVEGVHHFYGVAGGAAHIGFGFYVGIGINVGYHRHTWKLFPQLAHIASIFTLSPHSGQRLSFLAAISC